MTWKKMILWCLSCKTLLLRLMFLLLTDAEYVCVIFLMDLNLIYVSELYYVMNNFFFNIITAIHWFCISQILMFFWARKLMLYKARYTPIICIK
jgi:hypothetical protein